MDKCRQKSESYQSAHKNLIFCQILCDVCLQVCALERNSEKHGDEQHAWRQLSRVRARERERERSAAKRTVGLLSSSHRTRTSFRDVLLADYADSAAYIPHVRQLRCYFTDKSLLEQNKTKKQKKECSCSTSNTS